jgi:hypothetical protein
MYMGINHPGAGKMSNIEQFSAKMDSIGSILGSDNYYAIPDMQRDYQWDIDNGKKHGRYLWDCIDEFVDEDPDKTDCYYLGTMIIYKEGKTWMVIDGQQRLTTLSMMFMATRDHFDTAAKSGVSGQVTFRGSAYDISHIGFEIAKVTIGDNKKPKLVPKESSKANYKAFKGYLAPLGLRKDFPKKVGNHKFRIVQAYEMFSDEISKKFDLGKIKGLQNLADFTEHVLDGLAINLTIVNDLAQGYRIFSSENTTGLKLGNLDILRALVLAQVDRRKITPLEPIKKFLSLMMSWLDPVSQSDRNNFVRHFWIQKYGTPMNKSKLTNSMSNDIRQLADVETAMLFTDKLFKMAKYYSSNVVEACEDQEYFIPHSHLINCGFKQYRPILLGLLSRPRKSRLNKKQYLDLFKIIEILYVRFLLVGRQKGSILEPLFAEWAKQAANIEYNGDDLAKMWKIQAQKIPETFDFLEAFKILQIKDKKKLKYLLSKIEVVLDPYTGEEDLLGHVIEPILPHTNGHDAWTQSWRSFTAKHYSEKLHERIGNYVLLKEKTGHGIETSWETKKEYFENKTFTEIAKKISQAEAWTQRQISQTTSERAKIANIIWNLNKLDFKD